MIYVNIVLLAKTTKPDLEIAHKKPTKPDLEIAHSIQ
jgi:hypothetical protein